MYVTKRSEEAHNAVYRMKTPTIKNVSRRDDPVIEEYKKSVDRTLLRENLRLTPEQRLRRLQELQQFATELGKAGRAIRRRKT